MNPCCCPYSLNSYLILAHVLAAQRKPQNKAGLCSTSIKMPADGCGKSFSNSHYANCHGWHWYAGSRSRWLTVTAHTGGQTALFCQFHRGAVRLSSIISHVSPVVLLKVLCRLALVFMRSITENSYRRSSLGLPGYPWGSSKLIYHLFSLALYIYLRLFEYIWEWIRPPYLSNNPSPATWWGKSKLCTKQRKFFDPNSIAGNWRGEPNDIYKDAKTPCHRDNLSNC